MDKVINHWGKWIDSSKPVTGVLSIHSVSWEWIHDETCLTCEEIQAGIESDDSLTEEQKERELEFMECDSSHDKIIGDWLKDEKGLYYPNLNGEFAAVVRESTIQVVFSKHTSHGSPCSPCYPGQIDLDSAGEFMAYTLPDDLLYKE